MTDGYSSHADYISWVSDDAAKRQEAIESTLREAFRDFIESRQVEVVVFSNMSALALAKAIQHYPRVLKPLLAICNIAARAIERDIIIKNLDTYNPQLSTEQANAIAGYIKPFLPAYIEIPAASCLDRYAFIDKEIRTLKGRWEKLSLKALNKHGKSSFKKRKFKVGSDTFEIDAASPLHGPIGIAVDVKRIEARRDIHKRCDEIANKADKLKQCYPDAVFAAVIYYPFIDEHINIQNRLSSPKIEVVVFATESKDSVESAVKLLLDRIGARK